MKGSLMKKLFFRFDFSPKIKKFLTTLHNTQDRLFYGKSGSFFPFLFPRHCPLCDKLLPYGSFIHEECHRELPLIHSPVVCAAESLYPPTHKNTAMTAVPSQRVFKEDFLFFFIIRRPVLS